MSLLMKRRRAWLFVRIVWRQWEPGLRIGWRMALDVVRLIHPARDYA